MKRYIQMKSNFGLETVDEFDCSTKEGRKEAIRCVAEYRLSDRTTYFYLSSRCCKAWKNK